MTEKLSNGMYFAFKRCISPVSYCAMSIKTGTRDENQEYGGLAHFTEHLIFKGTSSRSAATINSYIEKLGGELNAYTTKEETVIHATVLKEDISSAIDLLVELSFRSVFPEKEIEKEKSVIIEEINSYKDSPSEQIFDDFEEYLFEGSSLSMPVLGKTASVKRIKRDIILEYYNSRFIPENMVFTVVADLDERVVMNKLLRAIAKYERGGGSNVNNVSQKGEAVKVEIHSTKSFIKEISKKNHQAHCIIGSTAYSLYEDKRIPLILLINLLGGPAANSILNILLREKNALVYGVESSFSQYTDIGVVSIYFGCDKENLEKCISLVYGVLSDLRDKTMSDRMLLSAKKQLLGQLAISSDNGESQVLSMGKSIMTFSKVIEMDRIREMIEKITPEDIKLVAQEVFSQNRLSRLVYK